MADTPPSHPLIVGTAGHIDHGKTALIKLLTGTDTDRLKEEKERGITIELGFASLTLPSGLRLGVVDVPGHERFVRHMLAGAGGIDLILDHKAALWDLAAGATILLEAGGRITSPAGAPLFPFDVVSYRGGAVPFLAGNPLAHAAAARSYRALVEPVRTREW